MTAPLPPSGPIHVFLDASGRRWKRLRSVGILVGVITSLAAAAVVISLLIPPSPPQLAMTASPPAHSSLVMGKLQRRRLTKRLQLFFELRRHRQAPSLRPAQLPVHPRRNLGKSAPPGDPVVAGFYVSWADNSLASLSAHADDLDWVVCEGAVLVPGGDSLRIGVDRRVPFTLAQRVPDERDRPRIFVMVSNYDSTAKRWDSRSLRHM